MMKHPSRSSPSGFTLMELMIAVAVVGILAAIAYPSYTDSIRRARRSDARSALLDLAARQERFYNQYNTYASSVTGSGSTGLGYSSADITVSNKTWYTVTLTATSTTFTLKATPKSGTDQVKDSCYAFAIDHLGQTTNADSNGGTLSASSGCW